MIGGSDGACGNRVELVQEEHVDILRAENSPVSRDLSPRMHEPSSKLGLRFALIFGVVAATLEMAALLWFMFG